MAFAAFDETTRELVGGGSDSLRFDYESGEYAILLRSDLKGRGLGLGVDAAPSSNMPGPIGLKVISGRRAAVRIW